MISDNIGFYLLSATFWIDIENSNDIIGVLSLNYHGIFPTIEKHVCSWPTNALFAYTVNRTIIKFKPFVLVLSIGSVVTSSKSAVMVADCIKLILRTGVFILTAKRWFNVFLFLFQLWNVGRHWLCVNNVFLYIQVQWKDYVFLIFLFS